jgi:hypothetical protein
LGAVQAEGRLPPVGNGETRLAQKERPLVNP